MKDAKILGRETFERKRVKAEMERVITLCSRDEWTEEEREHYRRTGIKPYREPRKPQVAEVIRLDRERRG